MLKFISNIIQLIIVTKLIYFGIKLVLFGSNKSKRKSIYSKAKKYFSNAIHHKLNCMLKQQKEAMRPQTIKAPIGNIVPFRKTGKKVLLKQSK